MTFRAIIVDDEPLAIDGLERLCERTGLVRLVGSATDGASALQLVEAEQPDVVFLDIGMPGLTGLEVSARLGRMARPPLVVLVTAYDHFATEAFDLGVIDYVLKPVEAVRLTRAVERAATALAKRQDTGSPKCPEAFWAPSRGGMVRVPAASIRRIDAERDYVRLHVEATSYLLRHPLAAIAQRLDPDLFLRIHRSTIVRLDTVYALKHLGSGAWVTVDTSGRQARIGRSYLAEAKAKLGVATGQGGVQGGGG
jgi:two-component system response regulator AlgR